MRKNHSKIVCIKLVHLPYLYTFIFIFTFTTCFGQLTVIRSSLQKLKQGACSTNSIHVIWDPI